MDTQRYYSTKEASDLTGASKQIIRVYTARYARYLSTEGTPESGKARRFTEADLKLLAYVYKQTSTGNMTHEQVLDSLAKSALDSFDWSISDSPESAPNATESAQSTTSVLLPIERFQAAQALLVDAQRREQEAREQAHALQEQINQLERDLGKAQGALESYQAVRRRPRWWVVLFGGE